MPDRWNGDTPLPLITELMVDGTGLGAAAGPTPVLARVAAFKFKGVEVFLNFPLLPPLPVLLAGGPTMMKLAAGVPTVVIGVSC